MTQNRAVLLAVTALGISSVITQITLTRELLNIFGGNELILGSVISFWLALTGAGTWAGKYIKKPVRALLLCLLITALLPFAHILILRFLRNIIALPGAAVSLKQAFIYLPLLMTPYCLAAGIPLTLACNLLSRGQKPISVGRVYFMDNIGDILGGLIFSFLLVYIADTYTALIMPGIFCSITLWAAGRAMGRHPLHWLAPFALAAVILLWVSDLNNISLQRLYIHQNIVHNTETHYGRVTVTRDAEQYNFFENGVPIFSTDNIQAMEEAVHIPLAQLGRPPTGDTPHSSTHPRILLLSGGAAGALEHVKKHKPHSIDYVELDRGILNAVQAFTSNLKSKDINIHKTDAGLFIDTTTRTYHAIISALPAPSTLHLNRFYTLEFFTRIKAVLTPSGVFSLSLPPAGNYINKELALLYSTVFTAGKSVFKYVQLYPLSQTVFVFSDMPLSPDPGRLMEERGIASTYTTPQYLDATLSQERVDHLITNLDRHIPPNKDLDPRAFRYHLGYTFSIFNLKIGWLPLVLAAITLFVFFKARPAEAVVFSSGFSAISLEIIFLLLMQIHSGYIYQTYAVMITLFMAGLATGSYLTASRLKSSVNHIKLLRGLDLALLVVCLLLAIGVTWTSLWKNDLIIYMATFLVSALAGSQFPCAAASSVSASNRTGTASRLYTYDFFGAAIGSFLSAIFFIPYLGIHYTLWLLTVFKLFSVFKSFR